MNKVKLTDALIRKQKPPEKRIEIYDEVVTGLILRVTKTGHKSFALRYWYDEKSKQITIGKYGDVSLAGARKKAKKLKLMVQNGADPLKERQAKRETLDEMTFRELADTYKSIHATGFRETTREYHNYLVRAKILPALGKRPVNEITKREIIRLLDKIAIDGGAKAVANKVRSRLHHIFEFAISRGLADHNPVTETKPYPAGINERERFYSNDEIKTLWEFFETFDEPVKSYLKIISLTGQRRTETHKMKWENIQRVEEKDFKGWVWTIPKDLAKSKREHEVQLSPAAVEIIQNLKDRAGSNPFVFASGVTDGVPVGLKTIKRAVKKIQDESGVDDFRLHDMRRTVATGLARLKTPAEVVSKVLNHKTGGGGNIVTRIYNRYDYRAERQRALNLWANELHRIISDDKGTKIHKMG